MHIPGILYIHSTWQTKVPTKSNSVSPGPRDSMIRQHLLSRRTKSLRYHLVDITESRLLQVYRRAEMTTARQFYGYPAAEMTESCQSSGHLGLRLLTPRQQRHLGAEMTESHQSEGYEKLTLTTFARPVQPQKRK